MATLWVERTPDGIWRVAVRGFFASIRRSTILLNAIAADLAPTMQISIPTQGLIPETTTPGFETASAAPISANGSAKSVWLNLIISRIWTVLDVSLAIFSSDLSLSSGPHLSLGHEVQPQHHAGF